jgi:hypothetical protein
VRPIQVNAAVRIHGFLEQLRSFAARTAANVLGSVGCSLPPDRERTCSPTSS